MEKKKILIVDDEMDIVETLSMALEKAGYECITANNGIDALNIARAENPNIILLDIMLPKMNGYKVARLLKFDEKYKHIPVIMLTARSQETDRIQGIETGADDYLTKPFDLKTLISMIKNHIR
jgi:DNA-binding response OmpR family regulator